MGEQEIENQLDTDSLQGEIPAQLDPQNTTQTTRFPGWMSGFGLVLALAALGLGISASWLEWGPDLHKKPRTTMTVDGEPVENVAEGIGSALGDVAIGFGKRVKDRVLKDDEELESPRVGLALTPVDPEQNAHRKSTPKKPEYTTAATLGFVSILTGVFAVGIGVTGIALGGSKPLAWFTIVLAIIGALLQAPMVLGIALAIVILAGLGGLGGLGLYM